MKIKKDTVISIALGLCNNLNNRIPADLLEQGPELDGINISYEQGPYKIKFSIEEKEVEENGK